MNVEHIADPKGGRFLIRETGRELAQMTYVWAGDDKMIIDHTEVDASLKGKGVGKMLVAAAVEQARREGFKIMPLCPFAKAVLDKEAGFHDVLW
jgi:predicted GNAT family acetyltransferase